MSDSHLPPVNQDPPEASDRRRTVRLRSKSRAIVLRDSDAMRTGVEGALLDVSAEGLGFALLEPLEPGEHIKIRVRNEIQRFEKEVRGIVRRVRADDDGAWLIGVELRSRLTPLDVSLLRTGLLPTPGSGESVWV